MFRKIFSLTAILTIIITNLINPINVYASSGTISMYAPTSIRAGTKSFSYSFTIKNTSGSTQTLGNCSIYVSKNLMPTGNITIAGKSYTGSFSGADTGTYYNFGITTTGKATLANNASVTVIGTMAFRTTTKAGDTATILKPGCTFASTSIVVTTTASRTIKVVAATSKTTSNTSNTVKELAAYTALKTNYSKFPNTFNGSSTLLSKITSSNYNKFKGYEVEIKGKGMIVWKNVIDLGNDSFSKNISNLTKYIIIKDSSIEVKSDVVKVLNSPATITLYVPEYSLDKYEIKRNGESSKGYVSNIKYDEKTKALSFDVTGFSKYEVVKKEEPTNNDLRITDVGEKVPNNNNTTTYIVLATILVIAAALALLGKKLLDDKKTQNSKPKKK